MYKFHRSLLVVPSEVNPFVITGAEGVPTCVLWGWRFSAASHFGELFVVVVFRPRKAARQNSLWLKRRAAIPRVDLLTNSCFCAGSTNTNTMRRSARFHYTQPAHNRAEDNRGTKNINSSLWCWCLLSPHNPLHWKALCAVNHSGAQQHQINNTKWDRHCLLSRSLALSTEIPWKDKKKHIILTDYVKPFSTEQKHLITVLITEKKKEAHSFPKTFGYFTFYFFAEITQTGRAGGILRGTYFSDGLKPSCCSGECFRVSVQSLHPLKDSDFVVFEGESFRETLLTSSAVVKCDSLAFGAFPGCVTRCFTLMSRFLRKWRSTLRDVAVFSLLFLLFRARKESWDIWGHEGS